MTEYATYDNLAEFKQGVDSDAAKKQDKIALPNDAAKFYNGTGQFTVPPSVRYATCDTPAATSAKSLTIADGREFTLTPYTPIAVLFKNGNTASSMTFSIDGKAAAPVSIVGNKNIEAGAVALFMFT